jgi:hypothetical protein
MDRPLRRDRKGARLQHCPAYGPTAPPRQPREPGGGASTGFQRTREMSRRSSSSLCPPLIVPAFLPNQRPSTLGSIACPPAPRRSAIARKAAKSCGRAAASFLRKGVAASLFRLRNSAAGCQAPGKGGPCSRSSPRHNRSYSARQLVSARPRSAPASTGSGRGAIKRAATRLSCRLVCRPGRWLRVRFTFQPKPLTPTAGSAVATARRNPQKRGPAIGGLARR